jgi:hypothetical protein
MPVQRPPQPRDRRVRRPARSADPPTPADIYAARRYIDRIVLSKGKLNIHFTSAMLTMLCHLGSRLPLCATEDDVGRAIIYEHSVASAAAIGAGM